MEGFKGERGAVRVILYFTSEYQTIEYRDMTRKRKSSLTNSYAEVSKHNLS